MEKVILTHTAYTLLSNETESYVQESACSYIDEHLWHEFESIKSRGVSPKGAFILGATIDEVEDRARQSTLGCTSQIVNRVTSGETSFAR